MDLARFEKSPSGRLVRTVDPQGRDYMAFVPHPLPPPLEYDIELVAALSEADRALGELAGLGRNLPNPQLLIQPFIHREAVLSSRIEGTQTDIAGLYAYEVGQPPPPGTPTTATMADALEVHNYVVALEYGLQRMETLPVSQRLICEVHQLLMQGVRGDRATPGVYRRMQNFIGTPGDTAQSAVYVPPPVSEMHDALDSFEKYLHERDEHPPLVRLAFTHYQFESIHPFLDGNGRMGRLLIALLLADWELLPNPLLYLSAYFERHRDRYMALLFRVSAEGAWRDWTVFFLRGVTEQAQDAGRRLRSIQDLQRDWRDRIMAHGRSSVRLLRLADQLFISPYLTIAMARDILEVSFPAAQSNVQKLVEAGILRSGGDSPRGRLFVADEVLWVVGEQAPAGHH